MISARQLSILAFCIAATASSGAAVAQSLVGCSPHEQHVAKAVEEGKELAKEDKFKDWIDKGLRTNAPYNVKPYTDYWAWYERIGLLSMLPDGSKTPEMENFFAKHGFTPSSAYSVIEDYALYGKPNSSVDLDFEAKMNAFKCP